jgi:hypothetical protein
MTTETAEKGTEYTYQCPKCNCEFTRQEGEPEACKCAQPKEDETVTQGCACCR